MNVEAEGLSRDRIGRVARKLRQLVGCEEEYNFPIVHFIEWILMDSGVTVEYVEPEEMRETYGTTNTAKDLIRIRSDVYEGAVKGNPRDRFTLCHEVGHYFLHQPEAISHARGEVPAYKDPEWQANTFAAELMAPSYLIKDMTVEEIMKKCGMSRQAATIQYRVVHKSFRRNP